MDRIPPGGRETIRALYKLGDGLAPYYVQEPSVDGGYVLRKPDHGVIIIREEKPRSGCAYDEFDTSILENVRCIIYCIADIGVESARHCDGGLINDYEFIFAVTDYEKFANLVKSGREDFDWLIYNTCVDARNDDSPLRKTPYPASVEFTEWELVIGDRILNPGPGLKDYCERQKDFREDMRRQWEEHHRARHPQFHGTVADLLWHADLLLHSLSFF
ncbi:hypothetical protein HDV63DRAFT_404192 [Trichoderma sp. SZMC 28014]